MSRLKCPLCRVEYHYDPCPKCGNIQGKKVKQKKSVISEYDLKYLNLISLTGYLGGIVEGLALRHDISEHVKIVCEKASKKYLDFFKNEERN